MNTSTEVYKYSTVPIQVLYSNGSNLKRAREFLVPVPVPVSVSQTRNPGARKPRQTPPNTSGLPSGLLLRSTAFLLSLMNQQLLSARHPFPLIRRKQTIHTTKHVLL
jgi:hypothetical protein